MSNLYIRYPSTYISGITGTIDTNLKQVGGVSISLGQKAMAASIPVVIASDQVAFPVTATVSIPSNGLTGSTVPAQATYIGANKSGNLTGLLIGAQTSANSLAVVIASDQTVPISGTITANQGTANSLANKWPVQITDGTNTMPTMDSTARPGYQKITDGSVSVAIKGASSPAVAVDPAMVVAISPNNSVTVAQSTATNLYATAYQGSANTLANAWPVKITDGTNTMPTMDVVGRAGFHKLTDGTNTITIKAASTPAAAADPALVVAISPNNTIPISGTVTATNPANGSTGAAVPAQANYIGVNSGGNLTGLTFGQATMANSIPVVIASNQGSLSIGALPAGSNVIGYTKQSGLSIATTPVYNSYSSTNITTSAYTQLVASTTSQTNWVDIFDSSGQAMILAVGAAGSEVAVLYVPPGGISCPLFITSANRISYKALTGNATSGYLLLNLRG